MSNISSRPEQSTTAEASLLTALNNLAVGGVGTAIQKTTSTTFSNVSVGAGGSMAIGGSITSATQGSVLFAGAAGVLAQNNAQHFWDDTNHWLGIGTAVPTNSVTIASTGNGIALYNTSDQVTNYQKATIGFSAGVFQIAATTGTSATGIDTRIAAAPNNGSGGISNYMNLSAMNLPRMSFLWASTNSATGNWYDFTGTSNNTSGNPAMVLVAIRPTLTQTSTAGYTALLIQPTETTTGSGAKLLISAGTNASPGLFTVSNTGHLLMEGVTSTGATGTGSIVFATAPTITLASASTAVTQAAGDNTTAVATDAFVTTAVANAISAINPAVAVQVATTANVAGYTYANGVSGIGATLTQNSAAVVVVDGYTLLLNDRILFKNQTSAFQNGVYFISTLGTGVIPAVFTRALDYDQPSDMNNTGAIPVVNGTVNATTSWLQTSTVNTVGTDSVTYTQFSYAPSAIPTLSGNNVFTGTNTLPTIAAPTNSSVNINAGSYNTIQTYSPAGGGTATLDCSKGNVHHITMPAGNITIALSNTSVGQCIIIRILQDATGGRTVTWFTTIKWAGGSPPTLTATASKGDTLGFEVTTAGSAYDGYVVGQNI